MSKKRSRKPNKAASRADYEASCQLTLELVGRFKIFGSGRPAFAMPPREIPVLASLADVGENLAKNDAARELLAQLIAECDRRKLDYPTVMILDFVLETHGIAVTRLQLADLGLKGKVIMKGDGGSA